MEYKHIKLWTMPQYYAGESWPNTYRAGVGQSRDSDALERSNFTAMLDLLGGESDTVTVVREGHWACGWVEWIAIDASDETACAAADAAMERLEDYPALDEDAWSNLEWEEASDYWDSLSPRAKVEMAIWTRKRYHWLQNEPVWPLGRLSFHQLANRDGEIANALYEQLVRGD